MQLDNRLSLVDYWKFNISLLKIQDFQNQFNSLIQWALVEVVIGNRWWFSLKYSIRYLAIKYSQKLKVASKLLGLNGFPYEVYLMLHMFVPILMDVFNHWFVLGAIPGSITKEIITLLKKGGKHIWEELDDYRPITLLNTELKILA